MVFSLYIEGYHPSTKEVTGYEFENIIGNWYKFIFQLTEITIQIWISITDSCTVIHQYSWIMDIHQTYMINMKCKYFMVLHKLQSDPFKNGSFSSKNKFREAFQFWCHASINCTCQLWFSWCTEANKCQISSLYIQISLPNLTHIMFGIILVTWHIMFGITLII